MSQSDRVDRHFRRLNLNLAYALDAILRAPTLTQAGHLIRLSQPAMSLALRKLRDHFDDELVVYHNNGRRLTALGEALEHPIGTLIQHAHDLFALDLTFDPATSRRTITIAAQEPVEIALLSWLIPILQAEAPGLSFVFRPLGDTADDAVDVAIVPERMLSSECCHVPLFAQSQRCLVWDDHSTIGTSISAEQYVAGRHVALSPELERSEAPEGTLNPAIAERDIVIRTDRYSSLGRLIVGTDLIVTANDWFAQYMASIYPLRIVGSPFPTRTMVYGQWKRYRDREPMIRWLRDRLVQGARDRWPALEDVA